MRASVKVMLFIVSFLISGQLLASQPVNLPSWFWAPPVSGNVLQAVGYSIPYYSMQSSYDEAFHDAARRLFTDMFCRVKGGRAMFSTPEGFFAAGNNISFEVDSAALEQFERSLIRVDSAATENLVVMLVATGELEAKQKKTHAHGFPDMEDYQCPGCLTGLGMGQLYLYESSSWEEAERSARIELALGSMVRQKSLDKRTESLSNTTISLETDVLLQNVQTVARGVDPVTGSKIVVVRMIR